MNAVLDIYIYTYNIYNIYSYNIYTIDTYVIYIIYIYTSKILPKSNNKKMLQNSLMAIKWWV